MLYYLKQKEIRRRFFRGLHGWLLLFSFYLRTVSSLPKNEIHFHIVTSLSSMLTHHFPNIFLLYRSPSTHIVEENVVGSNYPKEKKKKFMIASIKNLSPIINMCLALSRCNAICKVALLRIVCSLWMEIIKSFPRNEKLQALCVPREGNFDFVPHNSKLKEMEICWYFHSLRASHISALYTYTHVEREHWNSVIYFLYNPSRSLALWKLLKICGCSSYRCIVMLKYNIMWKCL